MLDFPGVTIYITVFSHSPRVDFLTTRDSARFSARWFGFFLEISAGPPKREVYGMGVANSLDGKHLAKHVELLKGLLPLIGLWMRMILFCCCHFQP